VSEAMGGATDAAMRSVKEPYRADEVVRRARRGARIGRGAPCSPRGAAVLHILHEGIVIMKTRTALVIAGIGLFALGCGGAETEVKTVAPTASAQPPPPAPPAPTQTMMVAEDAVLEGDRIRIAKSIFYDVDKDEIRPESFPVLNAVANIVKTHPEITLVIVEGHTDNQGTLEHNRKLSEKRANAVVRYLYTQGVTTPMQAPGYGASAPMCMEVTEDCRQKNRRVEFRVKRAQ
jgi:peptidoglycan-associated lipoprotein